MLCGLDLSPSLTGYCVGAGDAVPIAGAWSFEACGDDLGAMAAQLWDCLDWLHRRYGLTQIVYESPLWKPGDKLLKLRKLYGLGVVVELWALRNGVACAEASVSALKKELGGHRSADKDDMVYAAEKMGVRLPEQINAGRRDAADAVAAWLIAVRFYARQHQSRWDRILWSARGALL